MNKSFGIIVIKIKIIKDNIIKNYIMKTHIITKKCNSALKKEYFSIRKYNMITFFKHFVCSK